MYSIEVSEQSSHRTPGIQDVAGDSGLSGATTTYAPMALQYQG